ncbi:MoaD/ThiS family protein [Streptomyces noursei]|uniref:MoaD/ThiS family protein n=1 Tax=Streptomyces noursei TaxID=1971 RepID=UPI0033EA43C4
MTLLLSGTLQRFAGFEREITLPARTLAEALRHAEERYPQLRQVLRDSGGRLRGTHRVLINGELVSAPDDHLSLQDGDTVEILTAIAGG